jgi:Family of unknown function (DUF5681)
MRDEKDDPAENTRENTTADDGCPERLRPYQWQKGQPSPNPGGRPRKAPISNAYARHVEDPLPDDLRSKLRLSQGATWADAMALGQLRSAVRGNTVAAKEIADRIEGRVTQPISGENGEPVEVKWTVEVIGGGKEAEGEKTVRRPCPLIKP